jgi:hypothetical protein
MLNNLGDSPRPVGTLAHELGHNFGLPHPDTLSPSRLPATGPPAVRQAPPRRLFLWLPGWLGLALAGRGGCLVGWGVPR